MWEEEVDKVLFKITSYLPKGAQWKKKLRGVMEEDILDE